MSLLDSCETLKIPISRTPSDGEMWGLFTGSWTLNWPVLSGDDVVKGRVAMQVNLAPLRFHRIQFRPIPELQCAKFLCGLADAMLYVVPAQL